LRHRRRDVQDLEALVGHGVGQAAGEIREAIAVWATLFTKWQTWVVIVTAALLIWGGAYLYAEIKARTNATYQEAQQKIKVADEMVKQADAALKDVAAKDRAIAALSKEIETRRKAADTAIAEARAARIREERWIAENQRLAQVLTKIEQDRRLLVPVQTLQEAQREMEKRGYHPVLLPILR